jgi:hypothetical protein
MAVPILFASVLSFLLREIVVKFVVFSAVFALVAFLVPIAIGFISPHIGAGGLTSTFAGLGSGVWFFIDFLNLGFGLPLLISAGVARFLVRRLPLIG